MNPARWFTGNLVAGVVRASKALIAGSSKNLDYLQIATVTVQSGQIGDSATSLLGHWGATPIAQRAGSAQGLVTTAQVTTSTFGFSQTQGNAVLAQLAEIRNSLVAMGLWKGSA